MASEGEGVTDRAINGPPSTSADPPVDNRRRALVDDPRRVMVVHGRHKAATSALFAFLAALGLTPVDWEEAVAATGKGSPQNFEAAKAAIESSQATVVLFTPDDLARIDPRLLGRGNEDGLPQAGQPRPNVLIEAGLAMGIDPRNTILVEVGRLRGASDFDGLNAIRLGNDFGSRHALRRRLSSSGCPVNEAARYLDPETSGDFASAAHILAAVNPEHAPVPPAARASRTVSTAACSYGPDHMATFWTDGTGAVFHRWWDRARGWSAIRSWEDPRADHLAAVSRGPGDQVLFGVGDLGQVWVRKWERDDKGWVVPGDPEWIPGQVRGPLAAVSRGPGLLEVLAWTIDGHPCHLWYENRRSKTWTASW